MISIISPCYNERGSIDDYLSQFLDLQGDFEVIIVDGNSTDGTYKSIIQFQKKHPEITLKIIQESSFRAGAMNRGAKEARGDILLFLHIDSLLDKRGLLELDKMFKSFPQVSGGAFCIKWDTPKLYFRGIELYANVRSYVFKMFHGDQGIFVRAYIFKKIGGYPDIPLMEDVAFSQELKDYGKRRLLNLCVYSSPRRIIANGFWRMFFLYFYMKGLYYLGFNIQYIANLYKSSKKT